MTDQKFKKHAYILLVIFSIFTLIWVVGNQALLNILYYLLPLGVLYALYISLSRLRNDRRLGSYPKDNDPFLEVSIWRIATEIMLFVSGSFTLGMLFKLLPKTKALAFDKSLIEDFYLNLFSCFIVIVLYKSIIYLSRKRKGENSQTT